VHGIKEVHVRDAAMSRDCKTVAELVAYLTVFTKKSYDTIDTGMNELNPPKRPKLELQKYYRKSVRCVTIFIRIKKKITQLHDPGV
jgi:hypothetical protein